MITVEVLFFDGCPNHEPTVALVRDVISDLGIAAELREVAVEEPDSVEPMNETAPSAWHRSIAAGPAIVGCLASWVGRRSPSSARSTKALAQRSRTRS